MSRFNASRQAALISSLVIGLSTGLLGCSQPQHECVANPQLCAPTIVLETRYLTKVGGGDLKFSMQNLSERAPVSVQLTQGTLLISAPALTTLKSPNSEQKDYTGSFIASFNRDQLASFSVGEAELRVTAGLDLAMASGNGLKVHIANGDVTFAPSGIYPAEGTEDPYSPNPKQLAIGPDKSILASHGGKATGTETPIQRLRIYSLSHDSAQMKDTLTPAAVQYPNLSRDLPGDSVFAISGATLVLAYLNARDAASVIQSCPLSKSATTCQPEPAALLGFHALALGTDPSGTMLVAARDDGSLTAFGMSAAGINLQARRALNLDLKELKTTSVLLGVADLDGDSKLDVLAIHNSASDAWPSILSEQSDGIFATQPALSDALRHELDGQSAMSAPPPISAIALGNLDNDEVGLPDLAVARGGTISFYLNRGNGTFHKAPTQLVPQYKNASHPIDSLAIADLNEDGLGDVIIAATLNKLVGVYLSTSQPR